MQITMKPTIPWKAHAWMTVGLAANIALFRIPAVAEFMARALSFVPQDMCGDKHDPEPLGAANWLAHLPLMYFGLELCGAFWNQQTAFGKTMATVFSFNLLQGWLTMVEHSLIDVNRELQMQTWGLGGHFSMLFSVFVTGVVGWMPQRGWWLAPLVAYGIWIDAIGFHNVAGRTLSTAALAAMLSRSDVSTVFQAGYVMTALSPFAIPDSRTDWGHLVGALYVDAGVAIMMIGAHMAPPKIHNKTPQNHRKSHQKAHQKVA